MFRSGRLSRMLAEKDESDRTLLLDTSNRDVWYQVDFRMLEPDSSSTFHPSHFDQETETFIDTSAAISNSICLQLYYSMASAFLSFLITKTSINGLLNRGSMFLFSRNHFRNFIGLPDDWSPVGKKVLDLGAGDGGVTSVFADFFMHVSVTDASKIMEWRLAQKGFTVLAIDKWKNGGPYNLITALNLLDRHFNPTELLADLHEVASESNCLVMLSIVLPVRPYVEFNPNRTGSTQQLSSISVSGVRFEDHVNTLIRNTFQPAGFEVVRWTKLPYLCEGDMVRAFYKLDDAVFLLRPIAKLSATSSSVSPTYQAYTSSSTGAVRIPIQHDET
ncbi:DREV methyltransferase domain-containing protein [Ditylenchus destructor]|nr:DREV methyltransferase domain-containing protein [Ditylenchus destructor]